MSNLLSKLSRTTHSKPIEPREIFMVLPEKNKRYEYPRDVQTEVWKKWFEKRNQKNTIIKMNTGSGKTVVGLMILQSCLNDGKGPAIYVVPDPYLVQQVCEEAKELGIKTATDEKDYDYGENRAILVINIHKLVNGRSVFGMRQINNYPIGSVLIDDVHACLDTISAQFSLQISATHDLYQKVIELFTDFWKSYNNQSYADIVEMSNPNKNMLLPFWIWQEKQEELYRLLAQYDNNVEENKFVYFSLPLIRDCLNTCSCVISARNIEITPKGIPISKIESFEQASRRIFMSATLADDSVFISAIGLKRDEISNIITPDKANDIGDRLILLPKHLNSNIADDDIKQKILELANIHNVVVIVPSKTRGLFWDDTGSRLITKENIEAAVAALKKKHIGLLVFVNRYDGIDLPDDACRILVIDGLPPFRSEYDRYVQSVNPNSKLICREQVQKIEQGMGRGVRSNNDSCCVVIMGDKLLDILVRGKGVSYFSNATTEQYKLSKELWDLLKQEKPNPTVDDIFELAEFSLNREREWIEKSKECLSAVVYKTEPNIDETTVALRAAFENALIGQYAVAAKTIENVSNQDNDKRSQGFLKQLIAEYTNFFDRSKAQQILKSARTINSTLLMPIEGIQYEKLLSHNGQARSLINFIDSLNILANEYVINVSALLDDLSFSPDANGFEEALKKIGAYLGFASSRPEQEYRKGPDNLWAIGEGKYFVIECKSGTRTDTISKGYCNQLNGSKQWFETEYKGSGFTCIPIMIHNSSIFEFACSPSPNIRIVTPSLLDKYKNCIRDFIKALVQTENWQDERKINLLLLTYKLRGQDFISEYTSAYTVRPN